MSEEGFIIKETDLYEPIKQLLEDQNFIVKGEIKGCDIAALREDELWVVEMKKSFNITLLYQIMDRLSITPHVFAAIPRPQKANDRKFITLTKILKKLELGLITVSIDSPIKQAEIILLPGKSGKMGKKAAALRKEIKGRKGDTAGGSTRVMINTAYRERCIKIACILGQLNQDEAIAPNTLVKQYNCEKDAGNILRFNHYGWFVKIAKGKYAISLTGTQFLKENAENPVVAYYLNDVKIVLAAES